MNCGGNLFKCDRCGASFYDRGLRHGICEDCHSNPYHYCDECGSVVLDALDCCPMCNHWPSGDTSMYERDEDGEIDWNVYAGECSECGELIDDLRDHDCD